MDPVSLIVMSLAAGAAAGLKPTAEAAVRDAYAAIKGLLGRKYRGIQLEPLEQRPESDAKRASLKEDLEQEGAADDEELLEAARALAAAVKRHDPTAAKSAGVIIEDVTAGNLRIRSIDSEGEGFVLKRGTFEGDIELGEVRTGRRGPGSPNPQ
jgi:hypothetical protein